MFSPFTGISTLCATAAAPTLRSRVVELFQFDFLLCHYYFVFLLWLYLSCSCFSLGQFFLVFLDKFISCLQSVFVSLVSLCLFSPIVLYCQIYFLFSCVLSLYLSLSAICSPFTPVIIWLMSPGLLFSIHSPQYLSSFISVTALRFLMSTPVTSPLSPWFPLILLISAAFYSWIPFSSNSGFPNFCKFCSLFFH